MRDAQRSKVAGPVVSIYAPDMGEQAITHHHRVAVALKAVRGYLDLTQLQPADAAETSGTTTSRYENKHSPEIQSTIHVRIVEELDIPWGLLLHPPETAEVKEAMALYRVAQRPERRPH